MTRFSVGDRVVIRFGKQQGLKGTIIKSQTGDVYEVRVEDGSVLFFTGKGLGPKGELIPTALDILKGRKNSQGLSVHRP